MRCIVLLLQRRRHSVPLVPRSSSCVGRSDVRMDLHMSVRPDYKSRHSDFNGIFTACSPSGAPMVEYAAYGGRKRADLHP
jgi:hypothetical protein